MSEKQIYTEEELSDWHKDPSAYRQKLAKKIAEIVVCNPDKEFSDRISAVLAAEGVVDPAEVEAVRAYNRGLKEKNERLEQQLAALKAKWLGSEECLETWKSAAEKWEAEVTKLDADLAALRTAHRVAVEDLHNLNISKGVANGD